MQCAFCKHIETEVIETRVAVEGTSVRRRRRCLKCDKRFTTFERVETLPLLVLKRDGTRERFSRDKLRSGILKAVGKTWLTAENVEDIVNGVEQELVGDKDHEVTSSCIGDLVAGKLLTFDKLAYIRFSSVFKNYRNIEDFEAELRKLV